jgi:endonuclease YncB( thermonuclease family)
MVSIDTPEKQHYAGAAPTSQPKLDRCRDRMTSGFFDGVLPSDVRDYFITKITPDAAERHIDAANNATAKFKLFQTERLDQSGRVANIPTGEIVDRYGRMLSYIAPWLKPPLPPRDHPSRRTFNLQMIETGWAAFFPIYPSLPQNDDMNVAIAAAEAAWDNRLGQWTFGADLLLAYEFRACIKLSEAVGTARKAGENNRNFYTVADLDAARLALNADGWTITERTAADLTSKAFQRICVDLRDVSEVGEFGFVDVPPPYRLWFWADDASEARAALGL